MGTLVKFVSDPIEKRANRFAPVCGLRHRLIQLRRQLLTAQALVVTLDCRGELALALGGGLFVELAGAELGQEACLLDRALEAAQCHLEGLIFADADTGHWRINPFVTPTLELTLTNKSSRRQRSRQRERIL